MSTYYWSTQLICSIDMSHFTFSASILWAIEALLSLPKISRKKVKGNIHNISSVSLHGHYSQQPCTITISSPLPREIRLMFSSLSTFTLTTSHTSFLYTCECMCVCMCMCVCVCVWHVFIEGTHRRR